MDTYRSQSTLLSLILFFSLLILPRNCNPMLFSLAPAFSLPLCARKAHRAVFLLLSTLKFSCHSIRMTISLAIFLRFLLLTETVFPKLSLARHEKYSFSLTWILRKSHRRHWPIDWLRLLTR